MSEKRKPSVKIIAKRDGKTTLQLELFPASLWGWKGDYRGRVPYRVRLNGRWSWGREMKFWTMTQIMDQLRRKLIR